jgi:hypothetical protein
LILNWSEMSFNFLNDSKIGFNETQREEAQLIKFLRILANFKRENVIELTKMMTHGYFKEDEYLEVKTSDKIIFRNLNRGFKIPQIIKSINNKLFNSVTLSTVPLERFEFETIFTYDLGLCYSFNSHLSPFISPEYTQLK